jgi:hypothetical protein
VPDEVGGGEPYPGLVDSHPYAVAKAPKGGWYVADAAGNDILRVSREGRIRVVHVARPQRMKVTQAMATALDLDDCVVGESHAFEGVPTDVEVARSGRLIVSLLPGGPEEPSMGARGSVVRIHPGTGKSRTVANGILGATNVALAPRGRIFVTELFGNKISVVRKGRMRSFRRADAGGRGVLRRQAVRRHRRLRERVDRQGPGGLTA